MVPVDQKVLHDPENGKYGDCMRAAVASILELPSEEVPHFCKNGENTKGFNIRVGEFLKSKGYVLLDLTYFDIDENPAWFYYQRGIHHLISGYTERGTYHAVVGLDGKIIHDPHPSKAGLLEEKKKDWEFSFLVKI